MSAPAVYVCAWGLDAAELPDDVAETLTLARSLASSLGAELRLAAIGEVSDAARLDAARYAVAAIDRIRVPDGPADGDGRDVRPDLFVEAFARHFAREPAAAIVFAQTFDARLVAPRVAARIDAGVVMNCVDLARDGDALLATVTAYGGDTRAVYRCAGASTYVFAVAANAVAAAPLGGEQRAPRVRDVDLDLAGVGERIRVVQRAQASEGPRLEHAQIVVAGGRGLGSAENFHLVEELAAVLGGMAAASRPIVDDGWAKPAQQVGLTGKITKPGLYIAAGISGASQHMVGCAAAKTLVAINRDASAAIFRYARYGVIGDCLAILPELARAVRDARAKS